MGLEESHIFEHIDNLPPVSRKVVLAIALVGSLHIYATAQSREQLAKDPVLFITSASKSLAWTQPTEPAKIAGPIYYVGTKGLSSFLITTDEGHILLYTGMPGSGPLIEASIVKLGFKPRDIKYILTGHAHVDHVGGHAYMKRVSGAKVVMMAHEKELIESGGKSDFHYGKVPDFWFDAVKVDKVVTDGDTLKLGNISMAALLTAGHTKGSTTWTMTISENDKKYLVVFPDGTSVNPGYRIGKNPSYPGIADDYRSTLETLGKLKPDIWLGPHQQDFNYEGKLARSGTEGINAWIDPAGFKSFVATRRQRFQSELGSAAK
jgi:metallo-beta-lactamase class B